MGEKERLSFEEALKQLESIVQTLENEETTLENSVVLYQKGVELSKFCTDVLNNAELKISQVNEVNE